MADPTIEARLAALEDRLANLTVGDLPLAALKRKLETDWQPNGSVLLEPRSVTRDQIAKGLIVDGEDTMIQYGCVTAAGAKLFGTSFSVAHNATGKWTVMFTEPFPTNYVTVLTAFPGTTGIGIATLRTDVAYNSSQFGVYTINSTAYADLEFMFLCIGPR